MTLVGVRRRRECHRCDELPDDGCRHVGELVGAAGDLGRAHIGARDGETCGLEHDLAPVLLVLRLATDGGKPRVARREMRAE